MRYRAPDERIVIQDPSAEQMEKVLRESPPSYWQQGGNGEACLKSETSGVSLLIKQPEPDRFFFTYIKRPHDWLVPFDGSSCEELIEDERGGDPFWIPRASTVSVTEAIEVVRCFLDRQEPSPSIRWCYGCDLPLTDSYPRP